MLNGKLYEGNEGAGAELGHEVIRFGGEKCACGRRGCFEAYASAAALIRQTKHAMEKDGQSILWQLCNGDIGAVDGKTVFDGAATGDKTAKRVVNNYLRYLSEGLANIANTFRPEVILIGGGISGHLLLGVSLLQINLFTVLTMILASFVLLLFATLLPFHRIIRLKPIDAIRNL